MPLFLCGVCFSFVGSDPYFFSVIFFVRLFFDEAHFVMPQTCQEMMMTTSSTVSRVSKEAKHHK